MLYARLYSVIFKRHLWIIGIVLLAVLGMAACSGVSPAFGQYYQGRTLVINLVNIDRVPELRYTTISDDGTPRHSRIVASESEMELVVVHLKVENHTATSAFLNVDRTAAELRDLVSNKYFPIDVSDRVQDSDEPPTRNGKSARIFGLQPDGTFPDNKGFIRGPVELQKGMGIEGWIIFEAPKGTKFREFKWRAGDSLTITF